MQPIRPGFVAVFAGPQPSLVYEPIAFAAIVLLGDDDTQHLVSMIAGIGGWRPAEIVEGFLGVSAPEPDEAYWSRAADEAQPRGATHRQAPADGDGTASQDGAEQPDDLDGVDLEED